MKKIINLFALLLFTYSVFSQKVDIDNYRFYVEYAQLPTHKVAPEDRTFTVRTSGTQSNQAASIADNLNIRGWEYKEEGAKALVTLKVNSFKRGASNLSKEEKVTKNKAGEVTKRWNEYTVSSTNTGVATIRVTGPTNPYKKPLTEKQKKKKAKKDKDKKDKKDKKADNPFLKGVEISTEDPETNEPTGKVAGFSDLSNSYTVSSSAHRYSKNAYNDYNSKAGDVFNQQEEKFYNSLTSKATSALNRIYGYSRKRDYVKFKRLDSKKHPEFEMFDAATIAMKEILGKKRFNISFDEINVAMSPIIEYFESVKAKYSQDKKHPKRLKAAAMYNLAQIHLYLDNPEKTIEIGKEYIRWDHDKKDGKKFIEKGEALKHYLEFHGTKRYFETDEDADKVKSEDEAITGN